MTLLTIDSHFTGLSSQPEGTVAVCRGQRTTGMLWWKKTEMVWLVKLVKSVMTHSLYCGVEFDKYWVTVGVFLEREDADKLADELRSQG